MRRMVTRYIDCMKSQIPLIGSLLVLLGVPLLGMAQNYCKPPGNTGCGGTFGFLDAEIDRVELKNMSYSNFTSSCPAPGYEDLTAGKKATVTYGNEVRLVAEADGGSDGIRVWIDWNDDGTFDPDESVASALNGDINTLIRIPCDAKEGDLRMRVRTKSFDPVQPDEACGSFGQFDENMIKDFRVTVNTPPQPKTFQRATVSQVVGRAFPGENFVTNTELKLEFSEDCGPIMLNKVFLSNGKSSNPGRDISRVKLVKSGEVANPQALYYNDDVIGQPVRNPTGNFVINVNEPINLFTQHLYVTHDLSPNAKRGNVLDVTVDSFILAGKTYVPNVTNPPGVIDILGNKQYCNYLGCRSASFLVGIDSFDLTTINWAKTDPTQGSGPDWYTFLENEVAEVERQQTYTAKIASGTINGTRAKGWVDWNNDGVLDGSRETVFSTGEFRGITKVNIDVPCSADTGFHRLRIGTDFEFSQYIRPCEAEDCEGEYEDYRIDVKPTPDPIARIASADTFFVNAADSFQSELQLSPNWSYEWDLNGDGQFETTGSGALKAYSDTGIKEIGLKVTANLCDGKKVAQTTKNIRVVKPQRKPFVDFLASRNVISTDQTVKLFNFTRFGGTAYTWKVRPASKNGQPTSTFVKSNPNSFNPTVKFTQPGKYGIFLQSRNQQGVSSKVIANYIRVKKENLICSDQKSREKSGFLYDEGGPDGQYDAGDGECTFLINPRCADSAQITFSDFDVSNVICNTGATPDNIKVWDGTTKQGVPLHAAKGFPEGFSNNNAPGKRFTLTSQSGSFLVQFTTGGCANGEGFKARWETFQSADSNTKRILRKNQVLGPDTVYEGEVVTFNSTVNYPRSKTKYIFPTGDVLQSSDQSGVTNKIDANAGRRQIRAVTSVCGFSDTVSKTLVVLPVDKLPTVDFTASAKRISVGDTVQLMDKSFNGIFGWNWRIGTGNQQSLVTYVKGTSPTVRNPYIVFNQPGSYRAELIAENQIGKEVGVKLDFFEVVDYCEPTVSTASNDYAINQFKLSKENGQTLINNTTGNSGGYVEYKRSDVSLEAGRTYIASIGRNTSFNPISFVVWADLNKNGSFEQGEELISVKNFKGSRLTDTFTLRDQLEGGFNRLRVASGIGKRKPSSCGNNAVGETEDYKIKIFEDRTAPRLMLKDSQRLVARACTPLNLNKGATAFDIVDGNLDDQVRIFGNVDTTQAGTYRLVYRVSDQAGNVAEKVQTVVIRRDTVRPSITLNGVNPAQIEVFSGFNDPGVSTSDNCGPIQGVKVNSKLNNAILGSYPVTYTVTDNNGNKASVTRMVDVVDTEDPNVRLNGADTIFVPVSSTYQDPGADATDNYYDSVQLMRSGVVDPTEVGVYKLKYTAKDLSGNTASVTRIVKIVDNTAPTFTGVGDGVYILEVNNRLTYPYDFKDNFYSKAQISLVDRGGSFFKRFPNGVADTLGVFKATFTFEDGSGNKNTSNVAVKVVDRSAPSLTLIRDVVNLPRFKRFRDSLNRTYRVQDNFWPDTSITIRRSGNYFTQYVDSGFPNGLYEIRYQAIDNSGNRSSVKIRGVQIGQVTGLKDAADNAELEAYPNPTGGLFNLRISLDRTRSIDVRVIDGSGRTVKQVLSGSSVREGSYQVDLSDQSKGIYQVILRMDDEVVTKTVSVQ